MVHPPIVELLCLHDFHLIMERTVLQRVSKIFRDETTFCFVHRFIHDCQGISASARASLLSWRSQASFFLSSPTILVSALESTRCESMLNFYIRAFVRPRGCYGGSVELCSVSCVARRVVSWLLPHKARPRTRVAINVHSRTCTV